MNIWVIIIIAIIVILIALYFSWGSVKKTVITYASKKIMDHVKVETNPAEMQLSEDKTCGILRYKYLGQDYTLRIPFQKKLLRKIGYSIHHIKDDQEIEITNQPGVPILITPNDLGGGKIIIRKDEEIVEEFSGDQIIKF